MYQVEFYLENGFDAHHTMNLILVRVLRCFFYFSVKWIYIFYI